jgi:inner membrane protein
MASAFGHAAASLALGSTGIVKKINSKLLLLGVMVSILPDADSIGFKFGVPYSSFWGHRGFTHSITFAFLLSMLLIFSFYRSRTGKEKTSIFIFLFLSCISHALLDAMTTGGLGVAFFSPFNTHRYFFPFRPIKVSPISVSAFFKGQGLAVLKSELVWIGLPSIGLILLSFLIRKQKKRVLETEK